MKCSTVFKHFERDDGWRSTVDDSICIPLDNRKGFAGLFAIVDRADLDLVSGYKWYASFSSNRTRCCVVSVVDGRTIYMHRIISRPTADQEVDHKSGWGLDNRRSNLRNCTHAENMKNRRRNRDHKSPYKGVKLTNKSYAASLSCDGVLHRRSGFKTAEDAAGAYNDMALEYHGDYANLNDLTHPK